MKKLHTVRRPTLATLWLALALTPWFTGCATPNGQTTVVDAITSAPPAAGAIEAPAAPANTTVVAVDNLPPPSESDESFVAKPIDPVEPGRPVDLFDDKARVDLWARVRTGFAMPDIDTDLVRRSEQWYAQRPDYVQRMTERGSRYLFHVAEELDKRGMPMELALLPFIESAFNPQAQSVARASGMWQFIPSTGKDYDLKQNIFRDERRDVLASTRAALDYLSRLYKMFGDWHLALAAYNWGEGNVQRAIARNEKAGLPTDYLSLRMPDETRMYVPKLQAVKNIVMRPEAFGLELPELQNHPYFLAVPIERDIDVALAAKLADVSLEEFRFLNPQMNKPVILAAGTEQILLPYDNANLFVKAIANHHGALATWTAWVAPKTLRPADAAKQVGMSEATLREVNRIPPRMLVKAGSTLLVHRSPNRDTDVSEQLADNAVLAFAPDAPPLKRLTLRAGKRGETVASVAQRYRVSASQVAQWNKTSANGRFKAGSTIVVYVSGKSTTRTAAAPSTRSAGKAAARPVARSAAAPKAGPVRMTRK
ncbi:transglycosylase SLT domain-containing protein [Ideonella sp. DXS29W]|uniref:Transglycosylase SLT domain-containing protein n=1 Tax=Ideonella lacteola TaxID=2984193 RepID=A0ABU9BY19_9BURK